MTPKMELDHIVVSTERLTEGVAYVEDCLGVKMAPGGKHPHMGTHNALLGLGDAYLEVIAIDPEAPAPGRPRWFDLDNFSGAPRLTNWVAKTPDLDAALAVAPVGIGRPMRLTRDDLAWTVAVSDDGTLPFEGAFPGVIDWGGTPHPSTRLPDAGCRLRRWTVGGGPELHMALAAYEGGLAEAVDTGVTGFQAEIDTPSGVRTLR